MTKAAVFFDLDGTLLDTAPDFVQAAHQLVQEEGWEVSQWPTLAEIRPMVSHGSGHIIESLFQISREDPKFSGLLKRLLDFYAKVDFSCTPLFPGMREVLFHLESKGVPWGVVTNKPKYLTEPLIQAVGLWDRAACVVSGDTTPQKKPHPEPLFFACRQVAVDPGQCVYTGDAERDIVAGNEAGMTTVAALFGYIPSEFEARTWAAHHWVQNTTELLALMQKLL